MYFAIICVMAVLSLHWKKANHATFRAFAVGPKSTELQVGRRRREQVSFASVGSEQVNPASVCFWILLSLRFLFVWTSELRLWTWSS